MNHPATVVYNTPCYHGTLRRPPAAPPRRRREEPNGEIFSQGPGVIRLLIAPEASTPHHPLATAQFPDPGSVGMERAHPQQHPHKRVGQYDLYEAIGQGSFASVYRGEHRGTRRVVAVKAIVRAR